MLNLVICDDDQLSVKKLTDVIHQISDASLTIDIFYKATEILCLNKQYDICILDIDMPDVDGFELAQHLKTLNENTLIIFYSRLDHLVFESFKVHPFDFIRKSESNEQLLSKLQRAVQKASSNNHFYLYSKKSDVQRISYQDIVYFYKTMNDLNIHTIHGELRERKAIKDFFIPDYFYKVSSSLVINMNCVQSITDTKLIFDNGDYFNLSKQKARELKKHYILFLSE